MQHRRSSHIYRRCCLAVLIASTCAFSRDASVSAEESQVPPMLRIPAERSATNVHADSPLNSTLQIRIARRPWLLEKLTTPSPKPSIKMTPPRPPAAIPDPPSISLVVPENGSGWVTRGRVKTKVPNYVDLRINPEASDAKAAPSENLDAAAIKPQTKLQNVANEPSSETVEDVPVSDSGSTVGSDTSAPAMSSGATAPEKAGVTGTGNESDVSTVLEQNSVTAQKLKLELKGTSSSTSQTQIGEKSTATLKGGAVIVGDGDSAAENAAAVVAEEASVAPTQAAVSPKLAAESPTQSNESAAENTSIQSVDDSSPDLEMADSSVAGTDQPASSVPDNDQATDLTSDSSIDEQLEENSTAEASGTDTEKAEPNSETVSRKEDVVKVRKLKLQADGTVSDKSGLEDSEAASLKAEEEAKKAPASQFVSSENPLATKLDYTGRPAEPIKLTRSVSRMRNTIKQALLYHYARPETANERSNWGMLHSIMVFGADTKIRVSNRKYSAIAWIAGNNACRGQRLLTVENEAITARSGVGLQGHQGQFLAVFALCDVPLDYPIYASNEKFSIREIVESEMLACRSGEELTFSLIGLSHYLDTDTVWLNADGETWSFERLIKEELSQSIVGAACGGTHRLMGFAHALRKRRAAGKPITGQWKRAEIFMKDFEKYSYRLQNRDGSMSTDWFEGREDNGDMDRKIQTTGHMVEWLLTITPDSKLQEPRLVNAVRFLANTMYSERGHDWKIGPKGHALRSLAMYYERVYGGNKAWQPSSMAKSAGQSRR